MIKKINRYAKTVKDIPSLKLKKGDEFILTCQKISKLKSRFWFDNVEIPKKYLDFKTILIKTKPGREQKFAGDLWRHK